MTTELEKTLARELNEVADRLPVPPRPQLAAADLPRAGRSRPWQPLLVAAAVLLVIGLVAVVQRQQVGDSTEPAPPAPSEISGEPPTIPYVLDQQLHVGGTVVPGDWSMVESRGAVWLARMADGSWWWGGPGVDPGRIEAVIDQPPVLSPGGGYVGFVDLTGGEAHLTGFDTQPAGEGFGWARTDLPVTKGGVPIRVPAVTDDGDVLVQGTETRLMWRALYQDQRTVVDLDETAPDQVVLQNTPAGLVVVDGSDGATDATSTAPYLASLSPDGEITREAGLPTYDDLDVSPAGSWYVWSPAGTLGGEVPGVDRLLAAPVGADGEVELDAPEGSIFASGTWAWEDEENLVAVVLAPDGDPGLARCNVLVGSCRTIALPAAEPSSGAEPAPVDGTPEGALDAVVRAVTADDRALLADQAVIDSSAWEQLQSFADGGGGEGESCRDNGQGTRDCEIRFDADPARDHYAILEPAENAYGWRVSYVGIGGA